MIELYSWYTSNGRKASIALEELEIPYQVFPVDITRGEQQSADFIAISPNGKIPAIVDRESGGRTLMESGAILLYPPVVPSTFRNCSNSASLKLLVSA